MFFSFSRPPLELFYDALPLSSSGLFLYFCRGFEFAAVLFPFPIFFFVVSTFWSFDASDTCLNDILPTLSLPVVYFPPPFSLTGAAFIIFQR